MKTLVIAEHDNAGLKAATLNTITAALALGNPVDVLVAGSGCQGAAQAAAALQGVASVRIADNPAYADGLAENLAALVLSIAAGYSHIVAPASAYGKNFLPRVAALLDVAQISDVIKVLGPSSFVRPIYAGNILATVDSGDAVKVLTVR
ncbi:MAG TPA: electron transfer flavoprotein subunit alpha/FixB family protein, partial [Rhodocyclaceae bacterium]